MKNLIALALFFTCLQAPAKIEVLFHPRDPTLSKIAEWIGSAQSRVDIAMYNMDLTDRSPIIQKLKSPEIQARLRSGALKIRIIFEGPGPRKANETRLNLLEALGIDARYLGKAIKVHHKVAVLDTGSSLERVITGSANWSISSFTNYNENILFFEGEPELNYRYQTEFDRIWSRSKPFGIEKETFFNEPSFFDQNEIEIFFNSPRHFRMEGQEKNNLTEQVVRLIDAAKSQIEVATTRIRAEPILDAVKRAADRGLKIQILLSQDDFKDLNQRARWLFGNANIQLRVKFYNLKIGNYLGFQMHNKFMIIDRENLMSGSFNWSDSSENLHLENLVVLTGTASQSVIGTYTHEFESLWILGRSHLQELKERLAQSKAAGIHPACAFNPTALEISEINFLISEYQDCSSQK